MSLFNFKNSLVRELAWVMCSPNLLSPMLQSQRASDDIPLVWDADCRRYYQQFADQLQRLDQDPEPLHAWMATLKSPRLGIRFERYLEYWLHWITARTEDVISGLTINDPQPGGRTLGQLDFVWRDRHGSTQHWEAAVKYYLYWPAPGKSSASRHWLGPNANDSFEAKLTHLQQQQIPRAECKQVRHELQERDWDVVVHSALFLKGYLFYPLAEDGDDCETWRLGGGTRVIAPTTEVICRQRLSRAHLKGWWQKFPYSHLPRVSPQSRWLVLPKSDWLAPFAVFSEADLGDRGLELFNDDQLRHFCESHFTTSERAIMIVEMLDNGTYTHEISRAMVLDPSWPDLKNR